MERKSVWIYAIFVFLLTLKCDSPVTKRDVITSVNKQIRGSNVIKFSHANFLNLFKNETFYCYHFQFVFVWSWCASTINFIIFYTSILLFVYLFICLSILFYLYIFNIGNFYKDLSRSHLYFYFRNLMYKI